MKIIIYFNFYANKEGLAQIHEMLSEDFIHGSFSMM